MSCFADAVLPSAPPDTTKHVNYAYGMVLGVEEFVQEFAYLSARDQTLARELIGYGTVLGLQVTYTTQGGEPEVRVSEGLAVVPPGQFVRVTPGQCAKLNPWLSANRTDVAAMMASTSPVGSVRLAVVLRYHDCLTDEVPIPGEPCRSADDAMAPSRVKDDFRLELRLVRPVGVTLPDQTEEVVLARFAASLKAVPVDDDPLLPEFPLGTWEDLLKTWTPVLGLPGASIPRSRAAEFYRAAFRIWATELRPRYAREAGAVPPLPEDEPYLLLAELDVPLTSQLQVHDTQRPVVHEERRPILLHLRLIQELLCPCPAGGAGVSSPLSPPAAGPDPGNAVVGEGAFGQPPLPGSSLAYSRADHTHGTPPNPIPGHRDDPNAHALNGEVAGPVGTTRVARLLGVAIDPPATPPPALPEGQVLTLVGTGAAQRWAPAPVPATPTPDPPPITLNGDVTGAPGTSTVARIQGTPVAATAPTDRQILRCVVTVGQPQWVPEEFPPPPPVTLGGDVTSPGADGAVQVVGLRGIGIAGAPPVGGQVLQFQAATNDLQWVTPPPAPAPAPVLDQVVRHPAPGGRYEIVAAGSFLFDFAANQPPRPVGADVFNGLAGARTDRVTQSLTFRLGGLGPDGGEATPSTDDEPRYIVKLTPWPVSENNQPRVFSAFLLAFRGRDFTVGVRFADEGRVGRIQVEVSQYIF